MARRRPALYNLLTDPEFGDKWESEKFAYTLASRKVGVVPLHGPFSVECQLATQVLISFPHFFWVFTRF